MAPWQVQARTELITFSNGAINSEFFRSSPEGSISFPATKQLGVTPFDGEYMLGRGAIFYPAVPFVNEGITTVSAMVFLATPETAHGPAGTIYIFAGGQTPFTEAVPYNQWMSVQRSFSEPIARFGIHAIDNMNNQLMPYGVDDLNLTFAIPEPRSTALTLMGIAVLFWPSRRKSRVPWGQLLTIKK
jgi:hypothetical protein